MGSYGKTMHFIDHLGGPFSGNFPDAFFFSDLFGRRAGLRIRELRL
jgi:hypothetical protein